MNDALPIHKYEKQVFSQHGEDGIITHIFDKIGTTNKKLVEFGLSGRNVFDNSANLLINHDFSGLLMDKQEKRVEEATKFYSEHGVESDQLKIIQRFITAENINDILLEHDMTNIIDFLSIDIDGNDYWIWKAIDVIKPRLVVIEYNAQFGPELSFARKYDPDHNIPTIINYSASIRAFIELGKSKGYILIGTMTEGGNSFFVLEEDAIGIFDPVPADKCRFIKRKSDFKLDQFIDLDEV